MSARSIPKEFGKLVTTGSPKYLAHDRLTPGLIQRPASGSRKASKNEPSFELAGELKRRQGAEEENPWVKSRWATALRMAASTLRESESHLGAQLRRLRARLGTPKAITAMGAKLALLVYRMLKYGQEYVDKGTAQYEEKYRWN